MMNVVCKRKEKGKKKHNWCNCLTETEIHKGSWFERKGTWSEENRIIELAVDRQAQVAEQQQPWWKLLRIKCRSRCSNKEFTSNAYDTAAITKQILMALIENKKAWPFFQNLGQKK